MSVHSINLSEGPESSSTPVHPVGGTLNEWHVYIRHHTALYGGSAGTDVTAKGVYSEIDLKINILNVELRKAITNLQKSEIRLELTALGRDKVILSNEYDIFPIPVASRQVGTGRGRCRGQRQSSSSQRIVGKQSSKLPKKYTFLICLNLS